MPRSRTYYPSYGGRHRYDAEYVFRTYGAAAGPPSQEMWVALDRRLAESHAAFREVCATIAYREGNRPAPSIVFTGPEPEDL